MACPLEAHLKNQVKNNAKPIEANVKMSAMITLINGASKRCSH